MVDIIGLYLVQYLQGVRQCFRNIAEDVVHLLLSLEPLLLGIEHTCRVIQVLGSSQAEQVIVGLGILFVYKVGIIRTYQFDTVFACQLDKHLVCLLLQGECLTVGTDIGVGDLMALQFQVVVIAKDALMPLYGFAGSGYIAVENLPGHFASYTC